MRQQISAKEKELRELQLLLEENAGKRAATAAQLLEAEGAAGLGVPNAGAASPAASRRRRSRDALARPNLNAHGGASSSTSLVSVPSSALEVVPVVRRLPRVLLGASMPHFLGSAAVLQLITELHERICSFADVRLVVTEEVTKVQGSESIIDEVLHASLDPKRIKEGACETAVFSLSLIHI